MQLYLFRHGIAYERHEWSGNDASRPLTPEGEERTAEIVRRLQKDDKLKVQEIWSSPYVRAFQTADIAGRVLKLEVKVVEALKSGTDLDTLVAAFGNKPLPARLMLVGHEPDLGCMIGELIGCPAGDYALKKAGIALLDGEFKRNGMKLNWKLDPKDILP